MTHMRASIQLKNVCRYFRGVRAVNDVSFTLEAGETLALVGPNGAGKSTLIQMMSGIERIDAGQIIHNGQVLNGLPPERIAQRGIGRSFQTSRVFPALSVWDSVMLGVQVGLLRNESGRFLNSLVELAVNVLPIPFWRRRLQEQEQIVYNTLALFGERLLPRRDQAAFSLSYANRRRLEIARVLAAEPDFLLLDEPAAGMNPTETAELASLLQNLRQERPEMGILVVEHKLSLVRQVADRVIVLNQGEVLAQGTPTEALDDPRVIEAYLGRERSRPTLSDAHLG